jgi:hypothetical protein
MAHLALPELQRIERILSDEAVIAAGTLSCGEDIIAAKVAIGYALNAIATPAAREAASMYASNEIEIDDDAGTSPSDYGTWVQAWVWVEYPECETCDGSGEGEDGGDCTDCGGSGKGEIG